MNVTICRHGLPSVVWPLRPGLTLLEHFREAGLASSLHTPCGGRGTCRKCAVSVDGKTQLACLTKPAHDCLVVFPELGTQAICVGGLRMRYRVDSSVPGGYGIAADIGTTTVVLYAHDLTSGTLLGTVAESNQQSSFGADVISRIQFSEENEGGRLTESIREQLTSMARRLSECLGVSAAPSRWSIVGNTTMAHFLCGLDPASIARAPFAPVSLFGEKKSASEVGLWAGPGASVFMAPAISGYVGGDITAAALACALISQKRPALLLDIGTNGEIALYDPAARTLTCCATAAGPAFEGALLSHGMSARPGAVDRVWVEDNHLRYRTIGGDNPVGLCGSGLVDILAGLLQIGKIDETGLMEESFQLAAEVALTPKDVRMLQLAKAAIAAGLQTLLVRSGIEIDDIGTLFLAGGFGNYLRPESAAAIGLFPEKLLSKVRPVGNAAGAGAVAALLSQSARDRMKKIRQLAQYHELSGDAAFMSAYVENMVFNMRDIA